MKKSIFLCCILSYWTCFAHAGPVSKFEPFSTAELASYESQSAKSQSVAAEIQGGMDNSTEILISLIVIGVLVYLVIQETDSGGSAATTTSKSGSSGSSNSSSSSSGSSSSHGSSGGSPSTGASSGGSTTSSSSSNTRTNYPKEPRDSKECTDVRESRGDSKDNEDYRKCLDRAEQNIVSSSSNSTSSTPASAPATAPSAH